MKLTKSKKKLKTRTKEKRFIANIYKELMNHLPERIFYKDTHFRYILINKTFADDLGISPEDVVGKTDFDLFPEKFARKYRKDDQKVISSGEIKEFEDPYKPGKKNFVVHCVKVPLKDRYGNIKGILGIAYDITEKVVLIKKLKRQIKIFNTTFEEIIKAIMDIVETRDVYTSGHQKGTAKLACAIAKEMGCSKKQIERLQIAASIHDLGKIFIPMDILNKPSKLNEIEFSFVKTHPAHGYKLLNDIKMLSPIAKIVYQHHERLNGTGYPEGKRDGEISLEARILAVADVIDAMTSHRPYRPAHSLEEAIEEIEKNAGILYDKDVVKAAVKLLRTKKITLKNFKETTQITF